MTTALHAAATSAAAGNPAAARVVVEQAWPIVVRYCRARLGPETDALARRICGEVVTEYRPERDGHRPFLGHLYRIAAARVDAERATAPDRWLAELDPAVPRRRAVASGRGALGCRHGRSPRPAPHRGTGAAAPGDAPDRPVHRRIRRLTRVRRRIREHRLTPLPALAAVRAQAHRCPDAAAPGPVS